MQARKGAVIKAAASSNAATAHYVLYTTYCTLLVLYTTPRAHVQLPFYLDDPFLPGVNGDDLGVEKPPGATLILTMNRPIPNKAEPDCSWRVCEKYDS